MTKPKPTLHRPRRCTTAELKRAGVTMEGSGGALAKLKLTCDSCGHSWRPFVHAKSERANHGYWRCPDGCNAEAVR